MWIKYKYLDFLYSKTSKYSTDLINIDHNTNYIFIHIPKNAGTAIGKSLGIQSKSHITALEIKQSLKKNTFRQYFKFCFVRNPWDRFISLYNYARLEDSYYHSSRGDGLYGQHKDYELLKDASIDECAKFLVEGKLKHDESWNHWSPQVNWLTDKYGNSLVDYVGRYEALEEDLIFICKKLGIPIQPLKVSNSSRVRTNYRSFYSDYSQEVVADFYKDDIETFSYKF